MTKLIGIHGLARSGKDSVTDLLCKRYGFTSYAFAAPIKDGLIAMLRLTRAELDGPAKDVPLQRLGGMTPRKLMTSLGTDWGRNMVGDMLWIRLAEHWLLYQSRFSARVVISDVRFENEATWIRSRGGQVWHVRRPQRALDNTRDSHESENGVALSLGDSLIVNDRGLEELGSAVHAALLGELAVS